jgi:hypothetical protein
MAAYPIIQIKKTKAWRVWSGLLHWVIGMGVFAAMPNSTFAQACCSGGVPLGGSLGLGTAEQKTVQFLMTYDLNTLKDLMAIDRVLDDDTRTRQTNSWLLELNYGLSDRFSIAAVVPYITQIRTINGFEGIQEITKTQGLGDLVFLLKYRITRPGNESNQDWVVGVGPKLPTGKTTFTNNNGLKLPADMQPGSGSLDVFLWSYYQKSGLILPTLSLLNVVTFRKSGQNSSYNEVQTYEFGDEFQFNLGLNYNSFTVRWPVDFFVFGRYRSQTEDFIDGNTFPSTGGKWVYLIPGINVAFHPDMALRFTTDIPVYRKLDGTQLTTSSKFTFSLFYNMALLKKGKSDIVPNTIFQLNP